MGCVKKRRIPIARVCTCLMLNIWDIECHSIRISNISPNLVDVAIVKNCRQPNITHKYHSNRCTRGCLRWKPRRRALTRNCGTQSVLQWHRCTRLMPRRAKSRCLVCASRLQSRGVTNLSNFASFVQTVYNMCRYM